MVEQTSHMPQPSSRSGTTSTAATGNEKERPVVLNPGGVNAVVLGLWLAFAAATTLAVGDVILLEAGLSFLGLGVQPPTPSWGGMIFWSRSELVTAPWISLAPGVAIVLTVVAVNLVGDALQDASGEQQR